MKECLEKEKAERGPSQVCSHPNPRDPEPKTINPPKSAMLQHFMLASKTVGSKRQTVCVGMCGSVCEYVVYLCVCLFEETVCMYREGLTVQPQCSFKSAFNKGKIHNVECEEAPRQDSISLSNVYSSFYC